MHFKYNQSLKETNNKICFMGQLLDNFEIILFEILPKKRYIVGLWQPYMQCYLTDFAFTDEAFSVTVLHKYN